MKNWFVILSRSIMKQGILGDARASYWKLLIDAATRYRHLKENEGHCEKTLANRVACLPE
jgi:hypothetical protein